MPPAFPSAIHGTDMTCVYSLGSSGPKSSVSKRKSSNEELLKQIKTASKLEFRSCDI